MKLLTVSLLFILTRYRFFWKLRSTVKRIEFRIRNFLYEANRKAIYVKRQLFHVKEIARISLKDVFLVMMILAGIYLLPFIFFEIDFRDNRNIEAAYVEILSVVAGVCGVIIGLYYAAILSLGSSTYSKMPSEAKELLRKEPIGSVFIWYLSFLTFFSIALLTLYYFNFEDSFIGVQLVLLGAGFAIFGLSKLGYRLFYFTDPTILANSALDLLRESFELAKSGKFSSKHIAFQQHYNKQANISLNTYELLAKVARTEEHLQTESYLGLCEGGLFVLRDYLRLKKTIPYNSKFFQIKIKHKRWYESGGINLDMYEKIGHLPTDEIIDHNYIENKILGVVYDCIELNILNGSYEIAGRAISTLSSLTNLFATNHNSNLLMDFCRKVENIIFNNAPLENKFNNSAYYDSFLRIVDALGYLKSNILIEFFKFLDDLDVDSVDQTIEKLPWEKENNLFEHGILPIFTQETCLFLSKTIQYEVSTQGKRISPHWYVSNLLFLKYADGLFLHYKEIFSFTKEQLDLLNQSKMFKDSLTDKWANLYACCYLDRVLEHYQKLNLIIERFHSVYTKLQSFSKIESLTWPDYNPDVYSNDFSKLGISITNVISKSGALFNIYKFSSEYPDYGGKFLHFTANNILYHLVDKQVFDKDTFYKFHVSSLVMFEKIGSDLQQIENLSVSNRLHFMVAPIIDLVALSGLFILFAKFLKNYEYEKTVTDCWDNYLSKDAEQKIKKLSAILQYPETTFMSLPHRYTQRFNWHRDAFKYLTENLEIEDRWYTPRGAIGSQERHIVKHDSAMVRYLVAKRCSRLGGTKDEGLDIFIDYYLVPKADTLSIQDITFSKDQGRLAERISKEESKEKEHLGQEDYVDE